MHDTSSDRILIIGSGIGGLSSAIILSKLGYDVTVVEKNRQPGGMMRSFVREGVHCNVGVHYLGALGDGQVLRRCFDFLGISDNLPLVRMGIDGPIDRYHFKDPRLGIDTFDLVDGFDGYAENLYRAFPAERSQVDRLMQMLHRSAELMHHLDFLYSKQPAHFWLDHCESLGTVFDSLRCSPGLRAVFGMPSVLIGVPPAICPQFFHAMTLSSYLFSTWRLRDHGARLADCCVSRLTELGGKLRTGQQVQRICVENGEVSGVVLDTGERVAASTVIAAIHPKNVLGMLEPEAVKPSYRRRIMRLVDTKSIAGIHGLVPADSHPAIAHNVFSIDTEPDGSIDDLIYMQLRPSGMPNRNLLTLLTSGRQTLWQRWAGTESGRRGQAYRDAKDAFARRIIADIEPLAGSFSDLRIIDVFTPLSFRDWVGTPEGTAYGVMHSTDQLMSAAILNRTSLEGLYLAGQSVMAPGILGSILGSLATVQFIIGPERFASSINLQP